MSKNIALSGDLQFISLADVFQILGGSNRSGTLKLTRLNGLSEGLIYFADGNPINAIVGPVYGIDAINKMFGWLDARFEFCDERINVEPIINVGSMRIVLDALRLMDEGSIEIVGTESGSSNFNLNQLSGTKGSVVKGPPIDYAYFLDEERFPDGAKILGEGDEGNWLWVILEGTVRVSRETGTGPVTLGLLGEGSFIGTFTSFEYWKNTRFASVTAVGDVCLGVLDSVALCARYCGLSREFQKLLLGLSIRMKKINDRIVPPPPQYQPSDMLPDGTASMLEEKTLSHEAYIITNGEAYLFGKDAKSDQMLMKLEKDDMLGKLPFYYIGQEPHCATVMASEDFETQKINTDNIMKEYARLPRVLRNMINNVSTCVAKTTSDFLNQDGVSDEAETDNIPEVS